MSKRRIPSRPALIGLLAGVAVLGVAAVAFASTGLNRPEPTPTGFATIPLIEETLPPGLDLVTPEHVDQSATPMDLSVMQWQTDLQLAFQTNPDFGSPEISPDGRVFTITWHGEPSDELRAHIAAAPEGLEVLIRPADFPPGELQELVQRAMRSGLVPGVELVLGAVEGDASGIRFGLAAEPQGSTLDEIEEAIAAALGRSDVPVHVEISGGVVPILG